MTSDFRVPTGMTSNLLPTRMIGVVGYSLPNPLCCCCAFILFLLDFKSSSMMGCGSESGKSIRSTTKTTVAVLDCANVSKCLGTGAGGEGNSTEGSVEELARGEAWCD